MLVSPFQYAVHEPAVAVCMNASVRYLAPDSWDSVAGLPPLLGLEVGSEHVAGSCLALLELAALVLADAAPNPALARPTAAAVVTRAVSAACMGMRRLMRGPRIN